MTAYIFDVDGVITNLEKEIIIESKILNSIMNILKKEDTVALNTGRGIDWVQNAVLNPLQAMVSNPQILQNFFIVAESAGVQARFNNNYKLDIEVDESLKILPNLDQKVRELLQTVYSQSMQYESKKTMITTKIKEGYSVEKYHIDQQKIVIDLQKLIDYFGLSKQLKVDVSTIGTSIMNKTLGKGPGARLILKWLSTSRKIQPQKFITFGDSEADIEMAEEIYKHGFSVTYVYVGNKIKLKKDKYPFQIVFTKNSFDKGTLEYLSAKTA